LVKQSSCDVYNTIPKSREWLIVNCIINATRFTLLVFYIFKRSKMQENYITKNMHGNVEKNWKTIYLFNQWLSFFYKYVLGRVFQETWHLLILDGHGSHITI
jgi:hypothetical protein